MLGVPEVMGAEGVAQLLQSLPALLRSAHYKREAGGEEEAEQRTEQLLQQRQEGQASGQQQQQAGDQHPARGHTCLH